MKEKCYDCKKELDKKKFKCAECDLIEVLEELKLNKNKVFKSRNERSTYFNRYTVIDNRFVNIRFREGEIIDTEDIDLSRAFENINHIRYVEVEQFNKT